MDNMAYSALKAENGARKAVFDVYFDISAAFGGRTGEK